MGATPPDGFSDEVCTVTLDAPFGPADIADAIATTRWLATPTGVAKRRTTMAVQVASLEASADVGTPAAMPELAAERIRRRLTRPYMLDDLTDKPAAPGVLPPSSKRPLAAFARADAPRARTRPARVPS